MRSLHSYMALLLAICSFTSYTAAQEANPKILQERVFQERLKDEQSGEVLIQTILPPRREYEELCFRLAENAHFKRGPGLIRFWMVVNMQNRNQEQGFPIKTYGGFGDSDADLQVRNGRSFSSLETAGVIEFFTSLGFGEFAETIRGIHCIMLGTDKPQIILFSTEKGSSMEGAMRRNWMKNVYE